MAELSGNAGLQPSTVVEVGGFKISDVEFQHIRDYLHDTAGINLAADKKAMMISRLGPRLRKHGLSTFDEYVDLVADGKHTAEATAMVNLLTTNETYFFREPAHFEFIGEQICKSWRHGRPLRAWSAASSTGEETYSLAMELADKMGMKEWELLGSDINTEVLEFARAGHYRLHRLDHFPAGYLARYCLKGVRSQEGTFLVESRLWDKVHFRPVNLVVRHLEDNGSFDIIMLRNILIYFDQETCRQVVRNLCGRLNPGGYLFVSHTETLQKINSELKLVKPSVYQKA